MAFDINNQAHIDTIKAALLEPDFVAAANSGTAEVLELFNNPDKHLNGSVTDAARVTAETVVDAAFNVAIGSADQFKINLLIGAADSLSSDISNFRQRLMSISTNLNNELLLNVRALNRMEVDFAVLDDNGVREYITLSKRDYLAIRDA